MNILVVDDDAYILEVVKHMLKDEACSLSTASTVDEAIETIEKSDGFDLVITDIVMPEKDGTKLAQHIKETTPQIPVLAITAGMENAQDDYLNYAGFFADETMEKPLKKDALIAAIKRITTKDSAESAA